MKRELWAAFKFVVTDPAFMAIALGYSLSVFILVFILMWSLR